MSLPHVTIIQPLGRLDLSYMNKGVALSRWTSIARKHDDEVAGSIIIKYIPRGWSINQKACNMKKANRWAKRIHQGEKWVSSTKTPTQSNESNISKHMGVSQNCHEWKKFHEGVCWWMQLCETFSSLQTCEVWIIATMWSLSLILQT